MCFRSRIVFSVLNSSAKETRCWGASAEPAALAQSARVWRASVSTPECTSGVASNLARVRRVRARVTALARAAGHGSGRQRWGLARLQRAAAWQGAGRRQPGRGAVGSGLGPAEKGSTRLGVAYLIA